MDTRNYTLVDHVSVSGLLLCKFTGVLSKEAVLPVLEDVREIERRYPEGFNRFSDLSEVGAVSLTIPEIHEIARQRAMDYRGPEVRSAIHTPDPLAFGMMRVYAAMLDP